MLNWHRHMTGTKSLSTLGFPWPLFVCVVHTPQPLWETWLFIDYQFLFEEIQYLCF